MCPAEKLNLNASEWVCASSLSRGAENLAFFTVTLESQPYTIFKYLTHYLTEYSKNIQQLQL